MQSLQARVDSFHKTRRVKRYPSKSSSSAASVKWPHPPDFKANANTLAEAGFYFSPSWDDRDSVACFLCGKELSDWDEDDDPFQIHYTKCKNTCAWAVVRCGLTEDLDNKGCFVFKNKTRLPSNRAMQKARLDTFGKDWWPHDGESSHGATSVKMSQAGFVYTPQAAGDDTVTCLYCNLSLGGWETEDDPAQEHRTRGRESGAACPFLGLLDPQSEDELAAIQIADPPPPRAKRGKARTTTSTTSRPRRKTKAARSKSIKTSAPVSQRSPSPNQTETIQDPAPVLDARTSVDTSPTGVVAPQLLTRSPPLSNKSHQDTSTLDKSAAIPNVPLSTPEPSALGKADVLPGTVPNHLDLVVSLSPAGQPTVARSQLLTDHERTMSLEEWIRQEISLGYERLQTDGQRQIDLFKAKAVELRKCIDEL